MQELKNHMQLISNKKEKIKLALHIILVPSQSYIKFMNVKRFQASVTEDKILLCCSRSNPLCLYEKMSKFFKEI